MFTILIPFFILRAFWNYSSLQSFR